MSSVSKILNNDLLLGTTYLKLAKEYHKNAELNKASIYYIDAVYNFSKAKDSVNHVEALLNQGVLYYNFEKMKLALQHFYKALWIAKRNTLKTLSVKAILHVCEVYFFSDDKDNLRLNKPLIYELESFQPDDPLIHITRNIIFAMNLHINQKWIKAKMHWNIALYDQIDLIQSSYLINNIYKFKTYTLYKKWSKDSNYTLNKDFSQVEFCLQNWADYCKKALLFDILIINLIIYSKIYLLSKLFSKMRDKLNLALFYAKNNDLKNHLNLVSNLIINSERSKYDIASNVKVISENTKVIILQEIELYFANYLSVFQLMI